MPADKERPRGILTPADRAFLRGEKEFDHPQSRRNTRARIRERIRNGILDFSLLAAELDPQDRKRLFSGQATLPEDEYDYLILGGETPFPDATEEQQQFYTGIEDTLAFLFLGVTDAGPYFDVFLRNAIAKALVEKGLVLEDLDFEMEVSSAQLDEVINRFDENEELPRYLLAGLLASGEVTEERLAEYMYEVYGEGARREGDE